jgi:predicted anti-sigma-YlaC factor YlaD
MKICKQTLKEISINGTAVPVEVKAHLQKCDACAAAYREETALEKCLLSAKDLEAPGNLKYAILEATKNRQRKRSLIPALHFVLKTAAVLILIISGVWLGLQTANGRNSSASVDFDVTKAAPYRLNTEPLVPGNLAEIYFALLAEGKDAK